MDSVLYEQKNALRALMRQELARLSPEERRDRSVRLVARLAAQPAWAVARRVLLFAPLPVEPDLDLLWLSDALEDKECAYPRVVGPVIRLYFIEHVEELAPTRWGLREPEPAAAREADIRDFDMVLVPGLAFDPGGGRLGRGGGFYDRLLAERGPRSVVVGIGFDFQRVPELPRAPHDALMNYVCTEEGVLGAVSPVTTPR